MKRTLALILTLALMIFALASCAPARVPVDISGATNLDGLEGATIAAQSGTFHLDALNTIADKVTVKEFEDFAKLLIALQSGAIDGYVAEEPTALAVVADDDSLGYIPLKNNDTGFTATDADTGIAVAFRTGDARVATVNEILATISAETRASLMETIVEMSVDPDTAINKALPLVSDKTDTSAGTLKIAMECNYAPFNWTQTTDVNGAVKIAGSDFYANGYDVQVAKYIAAEMGMSLEVYAIDWNGLINGLNAGTYDGIIAGMSPTEEREAEVDFTDCYYNSNLVIIYKK
jgi:ABC-type amino acid transport substrate-binding protein